MLGRLKSLFLVLCIGGNQLGGGLTYRKGNRWSSELDVSLVSQSFLNSVESFLVHRDIPWPSDHAPIEHEVDLGNFRGQCVVDLLSRSSDLGKHITPKPTGKSQIRLGDINVNGFTQCLLQQNPPSIDNIDDAVYSITHILHTCAKSEKCYCYGECFRLRELMGASAGRSEFEEHLECDQLER